MTKYPLLYKKLCPVLTVIIPGIQICSERKTEAGMVPDERGGVSPLGGKKTVTPTSYPAPGHAGMLPVQSLLHQHHGHTIPGKMTVSQN